MIAWTGEPKSAEVRRAAQAALVSMPAPSALAEDVLLREMDMALAKVIAKPTDSPNPADY